MIGGLISLLIYLIVLGVVWWAINAILGLLGPYIAEPFMSVIRIIMILVLVLILISVLLSVLGVGGQVGLHMPMLR
jgi:uncharacterized membrane protein YwzB